MPSTRIYGFTLSEVKLMRTKCERHWRRHKLAPILIGYYA